MDTSLHKLICESAIAALKLQNQDGSMPPGSNSPHNDIETPARNTAYWLSVWRFYAETVDPAAVTLAMHRALDYLLSPAIRPYGKALRARFSDTKDQCNGVIGPAYCVEGLVAAGTYLLREDAIALAATLVANHPFDEKRKLWRVWDIDGRICECDSTLNHQIWWCMAIATLNNVGVSAGSREVGVFLNGLEQNMVLTPSGRIRHIAGSFRSGRSLRARLRELRSSARQIALRRENAYHAYNLYPLAVLRRLRPTELFWKSKILRRAIQYLDSKEYIATTESRPFLSPWIPGGYVYSYVERAFVHEVFGTASVEKRLQLVQEQIDLSYNRNTLFFDRGGQDRISQAARICEAIRLTDVPVVLK